MSSQILTSLMEDSCMRMQYDGYKKSNIHRQGLSLKHTFQTNNAKMGFLQG